MGNSSRGKPVLQRFKRPSFSMNRNKIEHASGPEAQFGQFYGPVT